MDYKKDAEIRKVMDKVADGVPLTRYERELVEEFRPKNYCYNEHDGYMGRRYKDL